MKYTLDFGGYGTTLLLLLAIFCVLIGIVVLKKNVTPDTTPPAVHDELRGGRFLIIRLPQTIKPFQEIQGFTDGHASRIKVVFDPKDVAQKLRLSDSERTKIEAIHAQWCQAIPRFRQIEPDEAFYDIGLLCDFERRRIKVPLDSLPSDIQTILEHVPPVKP